MIYYETLIIDQVNLQFGIEPEDFTLGVDQCQLKKNPQIQARMQEFNELASEIDNQTIDEILQSEEGEEHETALETDGDDLNDRVENFNFQYSQDMITNSLLDNTVTLEQCIGDRDISKIIPKRRESD